MHFNDHNPPHFYVRYNDYRAIIDIENFGILEDSLSARVLKLVIEWAEIHQSELKTNWDKIITSGQYSKIAPLVWGLI